VRVIVIYIKSTERLFPSSAAPLFESCVSTVTNPFTGVALHAGFIDKEGTPLGTILHVGFAGQICNVFTTGLQHSNTQHNKGLSLFVTGAPRENEKLFWKIEKITEPVLSEADSFMQANYECIQNDSFHPDARVCSATASQF
jgi:hypothetical protein